MRDLYKASSDEEKFEMSKELVRFVQNMGGRVLKKDPNGKWTVVPFDQARAKASRFLRGDKRLEK